MLDHDDYAERFSEDPTPKGSARPLIIFTCFMAALFFYGLWGVFA